MTIVKGGVSDAKQVVNTFPPLFARALLDAPSGVFGPARSHQPIVRVPVARRCRRRRSTRDQLACGLDGAFWSTAAVRPDLDPGTRGSVWLRVEESDDSFSDSSAD